MNGSRTLPVRAAAAALVVAVSVLCTACGRDAPEPPAGPPPARGPVARWRRGTEVTPDGRPAIVEALRPCVVTVSLWEEGRLTERDRRELEPGEFAKVVPTAAPRPSPMRLVPPPGETEAGRTHATMFQLGFSLDDRTGLGAFPCWWTKSTAPWARVQFSELPPSPADIADGASIVLAAVGVADAPETDASLRLELAFPPRVGGAGAAGAGPHLSALVLGVAAR